jgi:hypothetical protein
MEIHLPLHKRRNGDDLVCCGDEQCFPAFGFLNVNNFSPNTREFTLSLEDYNCEFNKEFGDILWIGGNRNFGHWLAESVAHLRAIDYLPTGANLRLLTTTLAPWQTNTLDLVSSNHTHDTIQAKANSSVNIYEISNFWRLLGQQLPDAYDFLRKSIALTLDPNGRFAQDSRDFSSRDILFLSRENWSINNRVKNESEIRMLLEPLGVKFLSPESLPYSQLYFFMRKAKLVICAPGATMFNYFAFGHDELYFLNLYPKHLFRNDLGLDVHIYWHLPYLSSVTFVLGENNEEQTSESQLDIPCHYDVRNLISFLRFFEKIDPSLFEQIPLVWESRPIAA